MSSNEALNRQVVDHPFASVMEVRGGLIERWHDYSHLVNVIDNTPQWWLEHIAGGESTKR